MWAHEEEPEMRTLKITDRSTARACAVCFALTMALAGGCERFHDVEAFQVPPHPVVTGKPYRVAPPDEIAIFSPQAKEIDGMHVEVSPSGTLDLPLMGSVPVAGLTVDEIGQAIQEKAAEFYQEVDVAVQVSAYRSKHIMVFGEVSAPGRYAYTGSDTILTLLARAQPSRLADDNRIQVIRPTGDGKTAHRMTIELGKWIERGELDRDALLQDGDIVYVPPNGLARVGLAMQQLLLPIQPAAATMRGPADIVDSSNRVSAGGANYGK
jgi:protein involved in polysaccharide export with SLBB domain